MANVSFNNAADAQYFDSLDAQGKYDYLVSQNPEWQGILDKFGGAKQFEPGVMGKLETYFDNLLTGQKDVSNSLQLQHDAQAFESAEADKNRAWQKMMSDTSYQRAAADLAAAGFNPALLLGSGAPSASTPSGSLPHSAIGHANGIKGFGDLLVPIFGILGNLISAGIRSSAMQAAQETKGQYMIDVAKLRGDNAIVINSASNVAAMERVKERNRAAYRRGVANNKAAMERVKEWKKEREKPEWYKKYLNDLGKAEKADRRAMKKSRDKELEALEHIFD